MKKDKNIVKDFGEWNVPTSWNEVTLGQFCDIKRYLDEKGINHFDVRTVLHILCNKTEDEVDQLPIDFAEALLTNLSFMEKEPEVGEPTNKIEIDGDTYIINVQEKLKLGEYVACDMAMKADQYDYPSILAILCRKENEKFDSYFQNEVFEKRKQMFEALPMTDGMTLIAFFLQSWLISDTTLANYLLGEIDVAIDSMRQSIKNSQGIGHLKRHYLNYRLKTLQKSLKSKKRT